MFLEVRTLALRDNALPHLFVDAAHGGPWFRLCRPGQCEELWAELRNARVEVLSTPTLLCLPGQEATMFVGVDHPAGLPEAWTGLRITTTPHLLEGNRLRLDFEARRRTNDGEQRTQITGAHLASGDTLIIASPTANGAGGSRFAALVTPTILRPTDLAATGRVAMLLYAPPARPGEVAKDATIIWEFAADKKKVAFVPGDYIVPNPDAPKRFQLVDVIREAPDAARWRLLYDIYEVPGDGTTVRRAELVHDSGPKWRPANDPFGMGPGSCALPLPPDRDFGDSPPPARRP